MKTKRLWYWLISILAFVVIVFTPNKITAEINKNQKISQITKNTPLILQHVSSAAVTNLEHESHTSHSSHASHASHASHYSGD